MATELKHTADMGFRVNSRTLSGLFEEAAFALTRLLVDTGKLERKRSRRFELHAPTREELLFDWLSELIYFFDGEHLLFCEFVVEVSKKETGEWQLNAFVSGERIDPQRHQIQIYIKAITLHQLKIAEDADGWFAEVYVDV